MDWGWSQCGQGLCHRRAPYRCCPQVSYCLSGWSHCPDSVCQNLHVRKKKNQSALYDIGLARYCAALRWLTSRELAWERAVHGVLWAVGAHRCSVPSTEIWHPVTRRHGRHRAVLPTLILKSTNVTIYSLFEFISSWISLWPIFNHWKHPEVLTV